MKNLFYRSKQFKEWIPWLVFALFLFFSIETILANDPNSGTGSIEGVVVEKKTGETLIGANVFIENTIIGTTTDYEGHFTLIN